MKNECLFCAIIHDEIPSCKIYEDDTFIAILDRFPKCEGHTLIIPKRHAATLFDLPDDAAAKLMPLARVLSNKLYEKLKFKGLNLLQNNGECAGQQVNHFHLHLIPRYESDDMVLTWKTIDPTPEDFTAMQQKLREN